MDTTEQLTPSPIRHFTKPHPLEWRPQPPWVRVRETRTLRSAALWRRKVECTGLSCLQVRPPAGQ